MWDPRQSRWRRMMLHSRLQLTQRLLCPLSRKKNLHVSLCWPHLMWVKSARHRPDAGLTYKLHALELAKAWRKSHAFAGFNLPAGCTQLWKDPHLPHQDIISTGCSGKQQDQVSPHLIHVHNPQHLNAGGPCISFLSRSCCKRKWAQMAGWKGVRCINVRTRQS